MHRFPIWSRIALLLEALALMAVLCMPGLAHAAQSSFFGPIISDACNCTGLAAGWGCILQTLQNGMNFFVSFSVVIITIFIALAGFAYMTSGGSAEKRTAANQKIFNAVIGLLIVLCAYLIVDSILKIIYNPNANNLGPWNSILGADPGAECLSVVAPPSSLPALLGANNASGGNGVAGSATVPPVNGTGACSASSVQSAAATGGYNISGSEANTLACLAKPESACGANTSGAKTVAGKQTSASGPWQIIVGAKDTCHSLNINACGNLNCSAAYSGGKVKSDSASVQLAQQCQAAANNLNCSAAAAACIVQQSKGKYSAWTKDPRSSTQKACIASYANGN